MSEDIKKAVSHPDVLRPSNDELIKLAWEVVHAIEVCGASPELTNAVTLASDLVTYLQKPDNSGKVSLSDDEYQHLQKYRWG